jgi:DNA polymerase-3 subunit alpha
MKEDSVKLLPPDINSSAVLFEVESSDVRYGLAAIKHVGEAMAEKIVEVRAEAPFESAAGFVNRMPPADMRLSVFQSLVAAGCFDSLGEKREMLLENAEDILARGAQKYREKEAGQETLFESKKKNMSAGAENWSASRLARAQKEAIGFSTREHPLEKYKQVHSFTQPATTENLLSEDSFSAALASPQLLAVAVEKYAGNDDTMARFSDESGEVILSLKPELYDSLLLHKPLLISLEENKGEHRVTDFSVLPSEVNSIGLEIYLTDHQRLDQLKNLKEALGASPGNQPVKLVISEGKELTELEPEEKIKMQPTLATHLKSILGPDHLRIFVS